MAEEQIDLRFLGEQIKRVQGDVRVLKTDVAQLRADLSQLEGVVAGLKADITRIDNRIDAFAESVDDRFEQVIELIKSNFRIQNQQSQELIGGVVQRLERIEAKLDK